MSLRFEWRTKSEGDDVLLIVEDERNTVLEARKADPVLLADFLNDMECMGANGAGTGLDGNVVTLPRFDGQVC